MNNSNLTIGNASASFRDDLDTRYANQPDGGYVRASAFDPALHREKHSAPAWSPTRVCTGPIRWTAGQEPQYVNQQNDSGPVRATVSHSGTAGGSVAATMQHLGGARTVELVPGNPSTRTLVETAVRAGLLESDGQGGFRDPGNVARAAEGPKATAPAAVVQEDLQEPAKPAPAAEIHEAFDAEDLDLWNQDIAPLPQAAYDAAVTRTMGAVVSGGAGDMDAALSHVANQLAQSAQIDQTLAAEYVQQGAAMYQRTVERALAKVGLEGQQDTQGFYKWMRQSQQEGMQKALQHLVHLQDPGEFVRLGTKYIGFKANRL